MDMRHEFDEVVGRTNKNNLKILKMSFSRLRNILCTKRVASDGVAFGRLWHPSITE